MNTLLKLRLLLLIASTSTYLNAQNNIQLQQMADADQKARMNTFAAGDWKALIEQDSIRRTKVYKLLKDGKVKTAQDYLNAGIIFQHGNDTIASKMAVTCFDKAINMDPSLNRWWYAAAVDRDLMRRGAPQIYGTQYVQTDDGNGNTIMAQYKTDTTKVTDEERQYYYVPTLAEQREKHRQMKLKQVGTFYKETNSIDKTITLIKTEFEKGDEATYNVSENMLNMLGYNLMNQDKNEEALKIFTINTELYPEAANTYDSLGECLLKLGKTGQGIQAYKKALELNPENDNARKIIEAHP
ncbi:MULTISPECIES: tetratricopeptide repeat protein [Galbibacter]|uniref:Tetratricopeptide repeat protein n=1 Tax=Galbibacter pacificus TaxID=2996052 RepID=A0ABT6FUQ6_9FLAO|nr:tetratricopeptide repeat protein [Galbibacter pacificus]MDG3583355.1 tetratricopeptide repeat protein [Galbibacter pacificus]MDG3586836.1 tetratricopeptide repeat protein [Galbibacter pacificus]